ncbi:MAG TPA: phosphate ABC transporter substrate-binding protein PstS [Candidatus Binataceae bacterium]|nr:phosphate ABC transporter substrate-binding protein PstS [Candidatus Binataceae bacterium]
MTLKYRMRVTGAIAIGAIFLCTGIASAEVRPKKLLLNASGSTFIFPIESAWSNVYEKSNPNLRINYQPIGSGGGIGQLMQQMTDFAGSDAPLTDAQLAKAPARILHFPAALGADVVAYNLPKIVPPARLRLTGPVVADIFRGKITKWNDPAIAVLNPALKLPAIDVVACHRSDGSGTTYIFTDYLSKVSPDWEKEIGKGTSVKWPVGAEANGNQGVTDLLTHTPGAIAYVEQTYAVEAKLAFAQIQNSAGEWIDPDLKSITIAANDSMNDLPADFRGSITNAPGAGAYPLSSYTYFLVYEHPRDLAKAAATRDFIGWVLRDGQTYSMQLHYAPLPEAIIKREEAQLDLIAPPAQARAR